MITMITQYYTLLGCHWFHRFSWCPMAFNGPISSILTLLIVDIRQFQNPSLFHSRSQDLQKMMSILAPSVLGIHTCHAPNITRVEFQNLGESLYM